MAMCLSSPVGKRVSREFPFTNAGNICANVELTIPKHLEVFSVTPDKFQVRPGMVRTSCFEGRLPRSHEDESRNYSRQGLSWDLRF